MAVSTQNADVWAITKAINQFSTDLFAKIAQHNPDNLIVSPFGASIVLAMAAVGSRGETEKEFKRVLHLSESVAETGYANLIDSINAIQNVELQLASKLFINDSFHIKSTFLELTHTAFRSACENTDFGLTGVYKINRWVEEQTNNRIENFLCPNDVNSNTSMMLVNAIYFKGTWAKEFEPYQTEFKPFYITKTHVVDVLTMYRFGNYRYGVLPELEAEFIEIPYRGRELSMIIILPDEIDGLAQVEQKLARQNFTEFIKASHERVVSLSLPTFKVECFFNLEAHLQNMGLKKAFDCENADFSDISDNGVYINSVVQKALIVVNEKGSGVMAATRSLCIRPSPATIYTELPVIFTIDRPFFYSIVRIKNSENDEVLMPLFKGHIIDPRF